LVLALGKMGRGEKREGFENVSMISRKRTQKWFREES